MGLIFDTILRLQGEAKVTDLIRRAQEYMEMKYGDSRPDLICRIYIRRIEHLYYKVYIQQTCWLGWLAYWLASWLRQ